VRARFAWLRSPAGPEASSGLDHLFVQASTRPEYVATGTDTFTGWTAGVGIEYAVSAKVSIKAEYQHFDFGEEHGYQTALMADPPTPAGFRFDNFTTVDFDTFKVGLNFHFN
jgi:outer membrane immunogenic protein